MERLSRSNLPSSLAQFNVWLQLCAASHNRCPTQARHLSNAQRRTVPRRAAKFEDVLAVESERSTENWTKFQEQHMGWLFF